MTMNKKKLTSKEGIKKYIKEKGLRTSEKFIHEVDWILSVVIDQACIACKENKKKTITANHLEDALLAADDEIKQPE